MQPKAWWEWLAAALIGLAAWAFFNRAQIRRWHARRRFEHMSDEPMPPIPPPPPDAHGPALADALGAAGFFDGLPPQRAVELRAEMQRDGYAAVFSHEGRGFAADDEDLAEGFIGDVLAQAAPVFAHLGMAPLSASSRFEEGGAHVVDVDGGGHWTMMSRSEVERDRAGDQPGLSWGLVGTRLLQRLNEHASRSGRSERFYSVAGGNDAWVLALTPSMLEAVRRHAGVRVDQLPYERTEHWPTFGQPDAA
jgi:hypothetical protein